MSRSPFRCTVNPQAAPQALAEAGAAQMTAGTEQGRSRNRTVATTTRYPREPGRCR